MSDANAQITAKVIQCLKRGNKLFKAKANIDTVNANYNFKKGFGSAGWNKAEGWYVRLSKAYVESNLDHILKDVIPHEVAHIICKWLWVNDRPFGDDGHGEGWKQVAVALGSDGEEYGRITFDYKTSAGNVVKVDQEQHDELQHKFKVLRDKDGNKITAAGFQA